MSSKSKRAAKVRREIKAENAPPNVLTGKREEVAPTRPSMARRLAEGDGVKVVKGRGL